MPSQEREQEAWPAVAVARTIHGLPCGPWITFGPAIGREPTETYLPAQAIQPLVEAIEDTFCDDVPCSRCAHLRAALTAFKALTEGSDHE